MMMKTEQWKIPFHSPGTRSHSALCTQNINTEHWNLYSSWKNYSKWKQHIWKHSFFV